MSADLLDRARAGDEQAFGELVGRYRRELQVHCYRILGSALDAEDALQETLLAAWQGLAGFEGRSSVRVWLFQIATRRCLNALRSASRRPPADMRRLWPVRARRITICGLTLTFVVANVSRIGFQLPREGSSWARRWRSSR